MAAVPVRPAWRDSDPRWRRRILAGVWLLALLPLMQVLRVSHLAASVPVPSVFGAGFALDTLDDTLLGYPGVYEPLIFCTGVALLFARERGRRRAPLDWTRRWGVLCCYVVLLLSATQLLYIAALVSTGIAAVFVGIPLGFQPRVTPLFVRVSTTYMRYGPQPMYSAEAALVAFSSAAVLLACVPLFEALRSSGSKRLAAILLAPLAAFALVHLAQVARYCAIGFAGTTFSYGWYFRTELPLGRLAGLPGFPGTSGVGLFPALVEVAKWCVVVAIAVWLTAARLAPKRKPR